MLTYHYLIYKIHLIFKTYMWALHLLLRFLKTNTFKPVNNRQNKIKQKNHPIKSVKTTSTATEVKTFQKLIWFCARDHIDIWQFTTACNAYIIMNIQLNKPGRQHCSIYYPIITLPLKE